MELKPDFTQNHLLAALPKDCLLRLQPELTAVSMTQGQVLYQTDLIIEHVYFPATAVVSLLFLLRDSTSAEISIVGNDGVVGVSVFMGGGSTPSRAVVQFAGTGFRLEASKLLQEFEKAGPTMNLLLRYTQALITQMTQIAACNRHHSMDKRLGNWLLLSLDRVERSDFVISQKFIANMLGISRESVTRVFRNLRQSGFIQYEHGHLKVLDRLGMERRCCECYEVVMKEYARLLP